MLLVKETFSFGKTAGHVAMHSLVHYYRAQQACTLKGQVENILRLETIQSLTQLLNSAIEKSRYVNYGCHRVLV